MRSKTKKRNSPEQVQVALPLPRPRRDATATLTSPPGVLLSVRKEAHMDDRPELISFKL